MHFPMNMTTLRLWRSLLDKPLRTLGICTLALVACSTSIALADATLTYELTGADGSKSVKKFSTARFFIRIDDAADNERYMLFQAGKFFPLYSVDQAKGTYELLTPPVIPYMSPVSRVHHGADKIEAGDGSKQTAKTNQKPAPVFKPTNQTRTVAGRECRVVNELLDDKPVIEHCMANTARLGITEWEMQKMKHLFDMAREQEFGWLGVGTKDQKFVSVYSRDLRDDRILQLTAVSTEPLAVGYLRIPKEYREIKAAEDEEAALPTGSNQTP